MLCRVSRDGLQNKWTPVKLADLFNEVAPSLVDQINAASRAGVSGLSTPTTGDYHTEVFSKALSIYKDKLLSASDFKLTPVEEQGLVATIAEAKDWGKSPSKQRQAFAKVRDAIAASVGDAAIDHDNDLRYRQEARDEAGLSLFPSLEVQSLAVPGHVNGASDDKNDRLLDVEVVAIYW